MRSQEPINYEVWKKYGDIFKERIESVVKQEIRELEKEFGVIIDLMNVEDQFIDWRFKIEC